MSACEKCGKQMVRREKYFGCDCQETGQHFCLGCGEHHLPADCSLNPDNFPKEPISERLKRLHCEMVACANEISGMNDNEARQHALELYGAAGVVMQWADKLKQ